MYMTYVRRRKRKHQGRNRKEKKPLVYNLGITSLSAIAKTVFGLKRTEVQLTTNSQYMYMMHSHN